MNSSSGLMDPSCPISHFVLVQRRWVQQNSSAPCSAAATTSAPSSSLSLEPITIGTPQEAAGIPNRAGSSASSSSVSASSSSSATAAVGWELVPGAVGGFCSVLVGHPLDLLKVRMQAGGGAVAAAASALPNASVLSPPSSRTRHHMGAHNHLYALRHTRPVLSSRPVGHHPHGLWNLSASSSLAGRKTPTYYAAPSGGGGVASTFFVDGAVAVAAARAPTAQSAFTATNSSLRGMAWDVVRQNGIRGLYAGMTAPLLAVVPAFGVTIGTFEAAKRHLISARRRHDREPSHDRALSHELTVAETAMAGAASGVLAAFILGPLEKVKCEFQLHPNRYQSFLDCFRVQLSGSPSHSRQLLPHPTQVPVDLTTWSISDPWYASRPSSAIMLPGQIRELFRGTLLTVCRDVPGNAMYFAVYESVRRFLLASSSWSDDDDATSASQRRRLMATMLAGGIAGVANWCLCLPVDAVKTRWQTSVPGAHAGPLDLLRTMLREGNGGIAPLYRGLGPAVLRAFPANAAALCAVDLTRQALGLPTL